MPYYSIDGASSFKLNLTQWVMPRNAFKQTTGQEFKRSKVKIEVLTKYVVAHFIPELLTGFRLKLLNSEYQR